MLPNFLTTVLTNLFFFCTDASICSVVYSHDGTQLAVGLSTGEVKVSDPLSSQHLFTLRDPVTHTKVRFYVYTPDLCIVTKFVQAQSLFFCTSAEPLISNLTYLF